jgi:hypothetical protein
MVDNVEFQVNWAPAPAPTGHPLLDDTLGRLAIRIGRDIATKYRTDNNNEGEELLIPTYGLAEWIASNWWPLLFEPPKHEDFQEDIDFRSRHWLGSARDGFALPDLWFCPAGEKMQIVGTAAQLRFARLSFLVEISEAAVETPVIRDALRKFVEQVIARLNDKGKGATSLHELWGAIRDTTADAEEYCQLIGALGLSPYDDHPHIDEVLDKLCDQLDHAIVKDLCNAADETTIPALAELTIGIAETLDKAQEAKLGELLAVGLPPDQLPFAWQWGREAAHQVRREFHISNADPEGGERFLAALDLASLMPIARQRADRISGGLRCHEDRMRLAIFDELLPQQRFTAARAAFLGWAHGVDGSHLVTSAITRDQQASRAFAAELLAPVGYIRTKAANRVLSDHAIDEIAHSLNAPAGAVRYQAQHAGIHVVESRGWGII